MQDGEQVEAVMRGWARSSPEWKVCSANVKNSLAAVVESRDETEKPSGAMRIINKCFPRKARTLLFLASYLRRSLLRRVGLRSMLCENHYAAKELPWKSHATNPFIYIPNRGQDGEAAG